MNRNQTFHEYYIPMLVNGLRLRTYCELGSHQNQTIGRVTAPIRIAVDQAEPPVRLPGIAYYVETTAQFIDQHAKLHAPFDCVFIDADHSEAAVRDDFNGIFEFVADEGLILLHDTNPDMEADTAPGLCGDAWKFARTLWSDGYEAVTLPYHPGLTLIRKRKTWGPVR